MIQGLCGFAVADCVFVVLRPLRQKRKYLGQRNTFFSFGLISNNFLRLLNDFSNLIIIAVMKKRILNTVVTNL